MIRLLASLVSLWVVGFFMFALTLPGPAGSIETDAIVVPTGGEGRISRGLALLQDGEAKRMLVTGVDREVLPGEFAAEYDIDETLITCCITLGKVAEDTKGNADETAGWMADNGYTTMRLVTTDWHMRRAALELEAELPDDVLVVKDAVQSDPSLRILILEYHKLIASFVSQYIPDRG